jgi:anti-sigma regulatory factor (Ser/Thr protein kinase)
LERANVKGLIRSLIASRGELTNREVARDLGLTRQAVHHHLKELVATGELTMHGAGRGARYTAANASTYTLTFPLDDLEPQAVWPALAAEVPVLAELPAPIAQTFFGATTEIVNNAQTHSGAQTVSLEVTASGAELALTITDEGIGAFESVRRHLGLERLVEAADRLLKGGISAAGQAGEGLLVVTRLAERLYIEANGLALRIDNEREDTALGTSPRSHGTRVRYVGRVDRAASLEDVLEALGGSAITRTRAVVALAMGSSEFVSREEARAVASGLDRFREVELDFCGVESVGQGFVDELFGSWQRAHPEVRLVPTRMNEAVAHWVNAKLTVGR